MPIDRQHGINLIFDLFPLATGDPEWNEVLAYIERRRHAAPVSAHPPGYPDLEVKVYAFIPQTTLTADGTAGTITATTSDGAERGMRLMHHTNCH